MEKICTECIRHARESIQNIERFMEFGIEFKLRLFNHVRKNLIFRIKILFIRNILIFIVDSQNFQHNSIFP